MILVSVVAHDKLRNYETVIHASHYDQYKKLSL